MRTTTLLLVVVVVAGFAAAFARGVAKPQDDKLTTYLGEAATFLEANAAELQRRVEKEPCNQVILRDLVERQEAMLDFADTFMHAGDSKWKSRFDKVAMKTKALRADVQAMRSCDH